MAAPSLLQARRRFEGSFSEAHVYDRETHPPSLPASQCPNGTPYVEIINGRLRLEGEDSPPALSEAEAVDAWYGAVTTLRDLMGCPRYLWWRELPEYEGGKIYSRLIMTHRGPFVSYAGKPICAKEVVDA